MRTVFTWGLIAFFFFGGLAFTLWDETSSIGIGQIWMAVSILLAVIFLLASGKLKGKLSGKFDSGSSGGSSGGDAGVKAAATINLGSGGDGAEDQAGQLERLERLRESGDLTDAEYQAQRQRILSQD